MDLIIKPTELCNFACTFCSSTDIADSKKDLLDLSYIERFLDRFPNTNNIIINGGDPLMVKPDYYFAILNLLEKRGMDWVQLSFTSNLWDFKKHPDKWTDLFRHPQVGVSTSFNYGDTRRITKRRVFTEKDFLEISDLFLERVGYRPDFISVIDESNVDTAIDNVRLAKRLNVECKLNQAVASGRQKKPFLWAKMYEIYIQIYREGLMPWEYNTKQMINKLGGFHTTCPLSRSCDSGIRAMNPNGEYYSCGSFADDRQFAIDFNAEMDSEEIATPLSSAFDLQSMHDACWSCEMFQLCNGCKKTVWDTKNAGQVEEHCRLMKTIAPELLEIASEHKRPVVWDSHHQGCG